MSTNKNRVAVGLSAVAVFLAAAALVLALDARESAYRRVVTEAWELAQPLYADLGVPHVASQPRTLREALDPLFALPKASANEHSPPSAGD